MKERVLAPILGTIVDVKVKVGDRVKVGEVLLILEAMKLENEILSPRNGVIKKIHVSRGKTVNSGDLLVVIE